jgi:Bivalent Mical/EHBP Rab binding domain
LQEKAISQELEEIQWRLQKYTDMEDSQKTETIREEEQRLLGQLVEAVNKKNELVLHLDNQEKAIAEDERIQTMVANKDFVALKKEEECVIQ